MFQIQFRIKIAIADKQLENLSMKSARLVSSFTFTPFSTHIFTACAVSPIVSGSKGSVVKLKNNPLICNSARFSKTPF